MRIQLSLSLHFYLLYLLSNSCDGNDATSDLKQRLIDTWGSISQNVLNEVMCMRKCERTSLWASAKIKPTLFRATNSPPRKAGYVSRHLRRSYSTANKLSKSQKTRKVEYVVFFQVCWCCLPKIGKIVKIILRLTKLQFGKVGSFFSDTV